MDTLEPVSRDQTNVNAGKTASHVPKRTKPNVIVIKRQALTTKKAVELLLTGNLKSKVCRYCLCITSPLSEVDQIMQIAGKGVLYKVTIRHIVASVHPFKVPDDPNFPNKICEKCLNKALQSYLFAQKCEQSGRALRNCFEDMYEKLDKLDPLERVKKRGRQKLHPNHNILYTENRFVIDYAEPIHSLINVSSESFTNEPQMTDLECKKCWQVLPNVESLANHEKIHPKSMWFNCRTCGKSFAKKVHIKRHLRMHARGKTPSIVEQNTNFVCKQCGHFSADYNLHLQHIEKHKFQTVLEHLVERKMDKLCSVCLSRSGKKIDMDKMICLHGGYPELTGDRSLYNILGATIPEPNYKYQELIVPQKSTIVTITKKTSKFEPATQIDFIFSPPKTISLNRESNCGVYVFEFSDPIDLHETNLTTIDLLEDPKDHEEKLTDYESDSTISVDSADDGENCDNDPIIQNVDESNKKVLFTFSKPEYAIDYKNIVQITTNTSTIEKLNSTEELCVKCWIFKKPSCEKCFYNRGLDTIRNMANIMIKSHFAKTCNYCWIFKRVGKCGYCKKPFKIPKINTEQNKAADSNSTKMYIDTLSTKIAQKRKIDTEHVISPKKTKWQCKICLTANNTDRETCLCCQSEKTYDDSVKVNIDYSFFEYMKAFEVKAKENLDINQNDVNYELPETILNEHIIEPVTREEQNQTIESSVEMMESSNLLSGFDIKDTNNSEFHVFGETMEMAIEDDSFSYITPKIEAKPLIVTEEDKPVATPNLVPILPFAQGLSLYPNPFSLGAFSFHHPPQKGHYQFNIGSMFKEDKLNNIKNIRKTIKRQKAIRK